MVTFYTRRRHNSQGGTSYMRDTPFLKSPAVPQTKSLPKAESLPKSPQPEGLQSTAQGITGSTDNSQPPSFLAEVASETTESASANTIIESQTPLVTAPAPIPSWQPLSPPVLSPVEENVDRVQNFFRARNDCPGSNNYVSVTRRFYHVSNAQYQSIIHSFLGENDERVGSAWQHLATRRYSLPEGFMSRFHTQMRQSLVLQGFLWSGWNSDWLVSSGTSTIRVEADGEMQEIMPEGTLRLINHQQPFLIVEIIDSEEYDNMVEKTRWILSNSKGKIRFAILIILDRKTEATMMQEYSESDDGELGLPEGMAASSKRAFREASTGTTPPPTHKRVRTEESAPAEEPSEYLPGQKRTRDSLTNTDNTHNSSTNKENVTIPPNAVDIEQSSSPLSDVSECIWAELFPFCPEVGKTVVLPSSPEAGKADVSPSGTDVAMADELYSPPEMGNVPTAPTDTSSTTRSNTPSLPNPHAKYSGAYVTVLSTAATPSRREVTTLLDRVQFWPELPEDEDVFSFGWEDMPVASFPNAMCGRRFIISFKPLNRYLEMFVNIADEAWVADNQDLLPMECADEDDADSELEDGEIRNEIFEVEVRGGAVGEEIEDVQGEMEESDTEQVYDANYSDCPSVGQSYE